MKICRKNHKYDVFLKRCPFCYKIAKKIANAKWYSLHKESESVRKKEKYNLRRKEYSLKKSLSYKQNPLKKRLMNEKWRKLNMGVVNAMSAKRKASKRKATPSWLTKEQLKEIKQFYILAQELAWLNQDGKPFHVDHIIPLQHDDVCGLHVPWNLQLLSQPENLSKLNSFDYSHNNNSWRL